MPSNQKVSRSRKKQIDPPVLAAVRDSDEDEIDLGTEVEECITDTDSDFRKASRQWSVYGGRRFTPCEEVQGKLDPGQYQIAFNESLGIHFVKKIVQVDNLLDLPDDASESILRDINTFWQREDFFRKYGFLWKRGILLWGPPGSGKTCLIQILSKKITDIGGISIYADGDPSFIARGLQILRHIEPLRPIILIFEDLDAIVHQYGENSLLALLDGELQIDNMVSIATTNYPEKLDERIINRPSRFDVIKMIDMPSAEARSVFLKAKNPRLANDPEELELWVKSTNKFSIAHMKELIVGVECLGDPFEKTLRRIKDMINHKFKLTSDVYEENKDKNSFGFNPG